MSKNYSTQIANVIKKFLDEDDFRYSFDSDLGIFRFGVSLSKSKMKNLNFLIHVQEKDFLTYAIAPIGADVNDKKMMFQMTECLCKINFLLKNGNFEMDLNDGELRYKSFVDCEDILPSVAMVQNSIYVPYMMFKKYLPDIEKIIFATPVSADKLGQIFDELFADAEEDEKNDGEDADEGKSSGLKTDLFDNAGDEQ